MEEIQSLIEKIQQDSDYFHKAKILDFLIQHKNLTVKELSDRLHMQSSYVCHILRLNRVPELIIDGYYSKLITLSHLFVLSRVKDREKMVGLYERILAENMTVLQTENLVREALHNVQTEGEKVPIDDVQKLTAALGKETDNVSVQVVQTRIKAKLVIEVKGSPKKTTETLKRLMHRIRNPGA